MTRRQLLGLGASLPVLLAAAAEAPPTPECGVGGVTPVNPEGPFFKPSTPLRASLLDDGEGERLVLEGRVLTTACRPLAGAVIELWHADATGAYDNAGYRWRGHQVTDADGRWRFETIVPGLYPGRTRHYHVKVLPPEGRRLTTQLYFPGEPANRRDGLFRPDLVMDVRGGVGRFDFVV